MWLRSSLLSFGLFILFIITNARFDSNVLKLPWRNRENFLEILNVIKILLQGASEKDIVQSGLDYTMHRSAKVRLVSYCKRLLIEGLLALLPDYRTGIALLCSGEARSAYHCGQTVHPILLA